MAHFYFSIYNNEGDINIINFLDTVGHEYGHFIQDLFIGNDYELNNLTRTYSAKNSSNMQWVEHWAILEGTADIMGMLLEANIEGISLTDSDFLYLGENSSELNSATRNHTADNTVGNQTVSEMYGYYSSDWRVAIVNVLNRCTIQGTSYGEGSNGPIYLESERDINEINDLIKSGDIEANILAGNELTYLLGPGHRDIYILVGVLRNMIESGNSKLLDQEIQLELWFNTITKLKDESQLINVREATLDYAKHRLDMDDATLDDIKKAFDAVEILSLETVESVADKWYTDSMLSIARMGILTDYSGSEGSIKPDSDLNQQEYIKLIVDFCNKAGANITENYNNGLATLTKPIYGESSHESMSLIFDESKDILRWEAFIIAYRILNFCHAEFNAKGWSSLYTYSYEDKKAGTTEYEDFMKDNIIVFEEAISESYTAILEKYFDDMSYDDFHSSYMYVRNNTSDWQTSQYNFGELDTMTETQHIIMTAMYNIYRALGNDFNTLTYEPEHGIANFWLDKKMTLANTCYLLYSFMN